MTPLSSLRRPRLRAQRKPRRQLRRVGTNARFLAPKYAGQFKVNPIAMLLTAKLMFDWLKETEMATRLESATARVIA
jgi:hypothetical protein